MEMDVDLMNENIQLISTINQPQEVIHSVNNSAADSGAATNPTDTGSAARANTRTRTDAAAHSTGWSVTDVVTPFPSDSSCAAGSGGRGGHPPTAISTADSGGDSFGGEQFSSGTITGTLVMSYPDPSEEPERRPPVILRVPWWARVLAAMSIAVAAICLAALVKSVFLVLFIPAMLLVSERGEM